MCTWEVSSEVEGGGEAVKWRLEVVAWREVAKEREMIGSALVGRVVVKAETEPTRSVSTEREGNFITGFGERV